MRVEVDVISKETIKPSSSTPDHLRHYRLSYLDQRTPPVHTSMTLFFESNGRTKPNITDLSNHLKKSLAQVLTIYYPLAGRSEEAGNIDCNDQGAPYLVAHVINCKLSDILRNPKPGELTTLVPFELDDADNKIPFGVQLNVFKCGGLAIGQCFAHKVADAISQFMFTKAWAAIARLAIVGSHRQAEIHHPEFISATLFPPKVFTHQPPELVTTAKNKVCKCFVFDASSIEDLRGKHVSSSEQQRRPSRVVALLSFIWSRFAAVSDQEDGRHNKLHVVGHAVNLRPRFDPPLPPHSFGNIVSGIAITLSALDTREDFHDRTQQEMSKVDEGYIKWLQQGGEHMNEEDLTGGRGTKIVTSISSSLCGFPLYDNDFGWGKPTWVFLGLPGNNFDITVLLVDTRDDDGIEAYISATEEIMTKLESDTTFGLFWTEKARMIKKPNTVQRSRI